MRYIWLVLIALLCMPVSEAHESLAHDRQEEIRELGDLANLALECGYAQQLSEETGHEGLYNGVEKRFFAALGKYELSAEQLELMADLYEEGRMSVIEKGLVKGKKITDEILEKEHMFFFRFFTSKEIFCIEVKKDGFRW